MPSVAEKLLGTRPPPAPQFLQDHESELDALGKELKAYLDRAFARYAGDGLVQLEAMVQDSLKQGLLKGQRREYLLNSYRWLKSRASAKEIFRKHVALFLEDCLSAEPLRKTSLAREPRSEAIARLEQAFAGIGHAIAKIKPIGVLREGEGEIHLQWIGQAADPEDARIVWVGGDGAMVSLRRSAEDAFAIHARLPQAEPDVYSRRVMRDVAAWRPTPIPNFSLPARRTQGPPSSMYWRENRIEPAPDKDFPKAMLQAKDRLPSAAEQDFFEACPDLSCRLEELLAAAARLDREFERTQPNAAAPSVVVALGHELARRANHPFDRIAELFRELLESPAKDCSAQTGALAALLNRLSEP